MVLRKLDSSQNSQVLALFHKEDDDKEEGLYFQKALSIPDLMAGFTDGAI